MTERTIREHFDIARNAAQRDGRSEKAMLFSGTAKRVYRLA
jgi:hypothetical protein